MKINYISGFYEKENDGVRDFRWMKKRGLIKINDLTSNNVIQIELACPRKQKEVVPLYINNVLCNENLSHQWHTINIFASNINFKDKRPGGGEYIEIKCDSLLDTDGKDPRELSLMIGKICIYSAKFYNGQKYMYKVPVNNDKGCIYYNENKNNIETGVIILDKDIELNDDKIYLDCIFDNFNNVHNNFTLKLYNNNFKKQYILKSQKRIGCSLKLPRQKEYYFSINNYLKIESANLRKNFYDFYNLSDEISPASLKNRNKTKDIANKLGLKIQWFVTWGCNYKCPYCWEESNKDIYRTELTNLNLIEPQKWADAFNKLNPSILYLTGGEPTLYKKLPELINLINSNSKIFITTNGGPSFDIAKYESIFLNNRFTYFACSFHPSEIKIDEFLLKMSICIKKKFNKHCRMGIEMVMHSNNIQYAKKLLNYCRKNDIYIYLDNFNDIHTEYKSNTVEQRLINSLISSANAINRNLNKKLEKEDETRKSDSLSDHYIVNDVIRNSPLVWCSAGMNSIHVDSKGDIYSCMSSLDRGKIFGRTALPHYDKLGNILDENNCLLRMPILCSEAYRCSACDYMFHGKAMTICQLENKNKLQIPIPE